MNLKVLSSSSKGNCYLLQGSSSLIIEAGVSIKEVKKNMNFDLSNVSGCLVSHYHGDHSKYANDYMKSGINIFMTKETKKKMNINSHRIKTIESEKIFKLDDWKILPFKTQHDCGGSIGFYISHPDLGNLLFATDTYYLEYCFDNMNHILIETNYAEDILQKNIKAGSISEHLAKRTRISHFELENTKKWLLANDLSKVKNIVLIHLSDSNSDSRRFKKEIEELTFIRTEIADKGLNIHLSP